MAEATKRTAAQSTKRVAKNSGELAGAALAIILTKVAEAYGFPLSDTEAVVLGGFLVGIGSSIRNLLIDD
jgi:hypothetical protein